MLLLATHDCHKILPYRTEHSFDRTFATEFALAFATFAAISASDGHKNNKKIIIELPSEEAEGAELISRRAKRRTVGKIEKIAMLCRLLLLLLLPVSLAWVGSSGSSFGGSKGKLPMKSAQSFGSAPVTQSVQRG